MTLEVLPPWVETASYHDQVLSVYRGNPLLEALPQIRSQEDVIPLLTYALPFCESDRDRSREERSHLIAQIPSFYEPLPMGLVLHERIDRMLRLGYTERNPRGVTFPRRVESMTATMCDRHPDMQPALRPGAFNSSKSMTVVGISGIGKTTAIEAALNLFPQVIVHSEYQGRAFPYKQLVWLKLNCPQDGSLRGLLMNLVMAFDDLLGTDYERSHQLSRSTVDRLIPAVARLAAWHGLGLLVIDEIQDLKRSKSGGEDRMLNFFVQLINTVGFPVVLVGTPQAIPILTKEFRMARRGTGQGDLVWNTMADKGGHNDDTANQEAVFRHFCESLWEYQYVRNPGMLSDRLLEALYAESAGITDIIVKLFVLAQLRAIDDGSECLTSNLIHLVAMEDLKLVRPTVQSLVRQDLPALSRLDDVLPVAPRRAITFSAHASPERDDYSRNADATSNEEPDLSPSPATGGSLSQSAVIDASSQPTQQSGSKRTRKPKRTTPSEGGRHGASVVALVAAGLKEHRPAHETLKASGLIRDLASEVAPPNLNAGTGVRAG